jgi:hypothetical protein
MDLPAFGLKIFGFGDQIYDFQVVMQALKGFPDRGKNFAHMERFGKEIAGPIPVGFLSIGHSF